MGRPKPHTVRGEPTAVSMQKIDAMFEVLFKDTSVGGAHAILSAGHSDAEAATVVRGGMIVGNSTPAWGLLAPGTSGYFLKMNSQDPEWAQIAETDILDGTLFARVASAETITGRWFFSTAGQPVLAQGIALRARNSGNTADIDMLTFSGSVMTLGSGSSTVSSIVIKGHTNVLLYAANLQMVQIDNTGITMSAFTVIKCDNGSAGAPSVVNNAGTTGFYWTSGIGVSISGTERTRFGANGELFHNAAVHFARSISPAALGSGNTNNYNPTDLNLAFALRLSTNAAGSTLTGLTAPTNGALAGDGKLHLIVNLGGTGALLLTHQDANSSAANQWWTRDGLTRTVAVGDNCLAWYDTTNNYWRILT